MKSQLINSHFFFFFFLPYHLFLHRLENRTKPISTPYDGRRWWDSNLRTPACKSPALPLCYGRRQFSFLDVIQAELYKVTIDRFSSVFSMMSKLSFSEVTVQEIDFSFLMLFNVNLCEVTIDEFCFSF